MATAWRNVSRQLLLTRPNQAQRLGVVKACLFNHRPATLRWLSTTSDHADHVSAPTAETQPTAVQDSETNDPHATSSPSPRWLPTLNHSLASGLGNMGISNPNAVQQAACESIYKRNNVMLRAETGSGKTLAYLVPLLQQALDRNFPAFFGLILVPSRELAVQVFNVASQLLEPSQGEKTGSRINCIGKGLLGEKKQLRRLQRDMPSLVVATPKQALELLAEESYLEQFETVVLDEIDHLLQPLRPYATERQRKLRHKHPKPTSLILDRIIFRRAVGPHELRDPLVATRRDIQLVGISATLGQPVRRELVHQRWTGRNDVIKVDSKTGSLPATLQHYVVTDFDDVERFDPHTEQRPPPTADALMDTVLHIIQASRANSVLLFVPTSVSIDDTVAMLRTTAIADDGHSAPPMMLRAEALYTHVHGVKPAEAQVRRQAIVNRIASASDSQPYVIVVNMDTARGLDLPGVEMAVLVGTPRTHSDYQHIAGRVGRAGCQGKVVTVGYDGKQTVRIKKMAASLKVDLMRMIV
eukprot:m.116884 g.116884  ORF g.116884 m.116884 type:complete len:527 (+) comp15524_c0_seq1:163-1743(+)